MAVKRRPGAAKEDTDDEKRTFPQRAGGMGRDRRPGGGATGRRGALAASARTWLWYGSLWLIGLAFVLTAFLYLPLLYISCCYVLTEEYVEFQCGVIFFHRRRMLRSSVMYVTVMKDPVSVLTRTRTVVLHAMGGRLVIPFLPVREVSALLRAVSPRKPREERHV